MSLCLPPGVLHTRSDGTKLDGSAHDFPGPVVESAEQIKNDTAIGLVETGPFFMVACLEVAVVDLVFPEVRIGLSGVAHGLAVILDDPFHAVAKPPR